MLKRTAIIVDGVVVNVTDSTTLIHPDGLLMVYSDTVEIGDLWDGTTFSKPTTPVNEAANATKEELLAQLQEIQAQITALP